MPQSVYVMKKSPGKNIFIKCKARENCYTDFP